ncbi:MAG: hypothetical protein CL920_33090 [Deltaproteobacteria bacterium]|nr:hypothetical protein [Deltaproteobacteria bacterium]
MSENTLIEELMKDYNEESAKQALDKVEKKALALTDEALQRPVLTDTSACLDAGKALLKIAKQDVATLSKLPGVSAKLIEEFATLRRAFWQASVLSLMSMSENRRRRLAAVVNELRIVRQRMFGAVDLVWPKAEDKQSLLESLRKGRGHVDLAADGASLSTLFRENHKEAAEWLNEKKLSTLVEDAGKLSSMLLELRQESDSTTAEAAHDLRARVYALYEDCFNQIADAGQYVFKRTNPERAEAYAPLYTAYLQIRKERFPARPAEETPETPATPATPETNE